MTFNLRKNSLWALAELAGSTVTLFVLYRIVVKSLGIEALGIWSLVLATTSLGRLADIGTAAGLGRFVATANAKRDHAGLIDYAETAIVTNFFLYLGIALAIWAPAYYALAFAMPVSSLAEGRALLPFSLISLVLMSLSNATTGAIIGQHRSDQKSMITLGGLALQLLVTLVFVPSFGLIALAWAQIAQYFLLIILGWFLFLRNHYGRWAWRLPYRWSRGVLKELMGFGVKLQAVTIVSMLYDPLIKFAMSSLGGLDALGYFEMARRLIMQVRQIIMLPTQPLVPSFAHLAETEPGKIEGLYRKATALTIAAGFPLLAGVALLSPLISWLWIQKIEADFVGFLVIMSAGWFVNIVAVPAYYMGIGLGRVKGNFYGACVTTGGGFVLSYMLGFMGKAYGVAMASSLTLAAGGIMTMVITCRAAHVPLLPSLHDFTGLWQMARDKLRERLA